MLSKMSATALIAVVVLTSGCVSNERFATASTELENQDQVIRKLREANGQLQRDVDDLRNKLDLAEAENGRLRQRAASADDVDALKSELDRLRQTFANIDRDIEFRQTPDGPALSVAGNVLFKTASDEISDQGREILTRISDRLAATGANIRVEGHSDNVPIVRNRDRFPLGNLELSGRRALNVADFLIESCGLPRERVSFAGYGAEQPVAANDSDEGRRRNRRVDIVVLDR